MQDNAGKKQNLSSANSGQNTTRGHNNQARGSGRGGNNGQTERGGHRSNNGQQSN